MKSKYLLAIALLLVSFVNAQNVGNTIAENQLITNATNQYASNLITVTVSTTPDCDIIISKFGKGTATANVSSTKGVTFLWSTGATTQTITGLNAGTYSVTVSDLFGSTTAKGTVGSVVSLPTTPASISGATTICSGSANVFNVTAVSGATSYIWTLPSGWVGSSTSDYITATPDATSGAITVSSVNVCGSSSAFSQAISVLTSVPSTPSNISGLSKICLGTTNTYSVTPIKGQSLYTWTLPKGWTGSSSTYKISATSSSSGGTIYVTADNVCGSSKPASQTISVDASIPATPTSITGNTSVCKGSQITYKAIGGSGATSYTWSIPATWVGSSTADSIIVTPDGTSGYISVSANNSCGSSSVFSEYIYVTTATPATPSSISGLSAICSGTSNSYSVIPVKGVNAYTWTLPKGWTGSSSSYKISATPSSNSGTIYVTADNVCGSSAPNALKVSVDVSLPSTPTTITGNTTVCKGSQVGYKATSSIGATSYTWTIPSGWVGGSTTDSITVTPDGTSGVISVVANNSCGSSSAISQSVTSISSLPLVPTSISGSTSICAGSSNTYATTTIKGVTSYIWTLPSGWKGSSSSEKISITANNNSGKISLQAVNTCGASSAFSIGITVNTIPSAPTSIVGPDTVCANSSNSYSTALVSNATSYLWTLSTGWVGSSSSNTISATANSTGGNISVTAINSCGSSSSFAKSITTAIIPSTPTLTSGADSICSGVSSAYSCAIVTGATSYNWILPSGWKGSSTTTKISLVPNTTSGSLILEAINKCGTSKQLSKAIIITNAPSTPGVISGATTICAGSKNTYTVAVVAGASSYTWTLPNGWTGTSSTNSITATANTTSGNISVVSVNKCGTSAAATLAVNVTQNTATLGTISGSTTICAGSSNTYSVATISGASSYTWTLPNGWKGSSTTNSISVVAGSSSGTITVAAVLSCGTSNISALPITVNTVPAAPTTISGSASICAGSITSYSVTAVNGATSYSWTLPNGWTGNSTTNSVSVTANSLGGTISVKAVNGCGSSSNSSQQITVNSKPIISGNIIGLSTICSGSLNAYSLAAISGATTYSWTLPNGWTGVSSTNNISVKANTSGGTLSVVASNLCGDSASISKTIVVSTLITPTINISSNTTSSCNGTSVIFNANVTNAGTNPTYQWQVDGINIPNTNNSTFKLSAIQNNVAVSCLLQTTSACASVSNVTSNKINISYSNSNFGIALTADKTVLSKSPFNVNFSNTTSNASKYNFIWSFGDGTFYKGLQPPITSGSNHTYSSNGKYTVSLMATEIATGCSDTLILKDYIECVNGTGNNCTQTAIISPSNTIKACVGGNVAMSVSTSAAVPTYQWNLNGAPIGGATQNKFIANSNGLYSATVYEKGGCPVTSTSVQITFNDKQPIAPKITQKGTITSCSAGTATLYASKGFSNYLWSTGATSDSIVINSSGVYTVTGINSVGCDALSNALVVNTSSLSTPEICYVSVDTTKNRNIIIWDKSPYSAAQVDSFIIYKEGIFAGVYNRIGAVNYNQLSFFIDAKSNSQVHADRYKVALKESCGNLSLPSSHFKTMHLQITPGVGNERNLSWTNAEGISTSYYYKIWRKHQAKWSLIDSVQSTLTTYTDIAPLSAKDSYIIEVVLSQGCSFSKSNQALKIRSTSNQSGNSVISDSTSSVIDIANEIEFNIIPNPSNGEFIISTNLVEKSTTLFVIDIVGNVVYNKLIVNEVTNVDLSGFAKGVYFIRVEDKIKKLVIQ